MECYVIFIPWHAMAGSCVPDGIEHYGVSGEPRLASVSALSEERPEHGKEDVEQALLRKGWESVEELSLQ